MEDTSRDVFRMRRRFLCTKVFALTVLFLLCCCFTLAALNWAYRLRRTSLQGIVTRMVPYMTPVVSEPETEKYYRVWRYHDFKADVHREPREPDIIPSVPIVYVHGNAGCFRDMRSIGRFIGESNVKLRERRARDFGADVRRTLFALYKRDGLPMPAHGETIPHSLQREAEDLVIADTPILSTELFGVDFLEESNTHSALLLVKEARFLNHTVHALLTKLEQHYSGSGAQAQIDAAEREYLDSICHRASASSACATARAQTQKYSTAQRIQAEIAHVRRDGLWLWTESLGGLVALYAALMAPELYAGLVMAGSPLRYPPLLFDLSCVQLQRAVHDAAVAFPPPPPLSPEYVTMNWSTVFTAGITASELLRRVSQVPPGAFAARLLRVNLVNINGGGLEDIVPPMSSFLLRSTGRARASPMHTAQLRAPPSLAGRRDVCTEEMRDCGMSLTHRGLVYAEQLLEGAAVSLVRAALTPNAAALLGPEHSLPFGAQRLFPMVVESLPKSMETWRRESFFFSQSLRAAQSGELRREDPHAAVAASTVELCTDAKEEVNLQDIPRSEDEREEEDVESWGALHIFIGSTSFEPREVHLPELRFVARDGTLFSSGVKTRAATLFHLPTRRRDSVFNDGEALRTAVSFVVHTYGDRLKSPVWLRPRFCFRVDNAAVNIGVHQSIMQYDRIDPLANDSAQRSGELFVERYNRFTLVRNIDSMFMETRLTVHVENSSVFPHVICGSLRSFRLALHGTETLAFDEPESQLQYFYGPYEKDLPYFEYSWRPFHTAPFNLTNLYMVYVLSGDRQPDVTLHDLGLYQFPRWDTLEYWMWRFERWRMRWMAVLVTYSTPGKFAGSYTLLFFTLYLCFSIRRYLGQTKTSRTVSYQVFTTFSPLFTVLVVGVLFEIICGFLAERALTVCLMDDPPLLSDEEMTGMMGVVEKLALIVLYALPPRYAECRYSWIRFQTVMPKDVMFEHLMHLGSGFCFAVFLFVFEAIAFYLVGFISLCFGNIIDRVFPCRTERILTIFLCALWFIPMILYFSVPWLHISIITTIACVLGYAAIWQIPWEINDGSGPNYRWLCFWITMIVHFCSHFEGLVLVVRNYIMVPRDVLDDHERFDTLSEHQVAFVVAQLSLAVVYSTVFLTRIHQANSNSYTNHKKRDNGTRADEANNCSYVIGSLCHNHPSLDQVLGACCKALTIISLWVCAISLRRPLEGTFCLIGLCVLAVFLSVLLVRLW